MRKNRYLLISLICLAAVLGLIALLAPDEGPDHQGRSLAEWLRIAYESDRPNRDPAQSALAATAIRTIGTNALPHLLAWIRYEAPPWHQHLAAVLPRSLALVVGNSRPARATVYRDFHRAQAAQHGFRLLGTNAVPALPELTRIALDKEAPQSAERASQLLLHLTNSVSQ